jgi:hypothetical protein
MPLTEWQKASMRRRARRERRDDPFDMRGMPIIEEKRKRGRPTSKRDLIASQMRKDYPDFATLSARPLKHLSAQYDGDRKTIKAALAIARNGWN